MGDAHMAIQARLNQALHKLSHSLYNTYHLYKSGIKLLQVIFKELCQFQELGIFHGRSPIVISCSLMRLLLIASNILTFSKFFLSKALSLCFQTKLFSVLQTLHVVVFVAARCEGPVYRRVSLRRNVRLTQLWQSRRLRF